MQALRGEKQPPSPESPSPPAGLVLVGFLLFHVLFQAGTTTQIKPPPQQKLYSLSASLSLSTNPSGPSPLYHLVPTGQGEGPHLLQPGSPGIELHYPKEMMDIT